MEDTAGVVGYIVTGGLVLATAWIAINGIVYTVRDWSMIKEKVGIKWHGRESN